MIRCIVDDELKITEHLLITLEEKIKFYWPNACLILRNEEKYWKYDNSRDIVYNVSYENLNNIHKISQCFKVSWYYLPEEKYRGNLSAEDGVEEAIWSKNVHPDEIFLLSAVEWVHVYTWVE